MRRLNDDKSQRDLKFQISNLRLEIGSRRGRNQCGTTLRVVNRDAERRATMRARQHEFENW